MASIGMNSIGTNDSIGMNSIGMDGSIGVKISKVGLGFSGAEETWTTDRRTEGRTEGEANFRVWKRGRRFTSGALPNLPAPRALVLFKLHPFYPKTRRAKRERVFSGGRKD